jgi:hypothetical protein
VIVSHSHKFIFIKSRKTGGTSVEALLSSFCSGEDIVTPLGDYRFNRGENGEWIHHSMNAGEFHQHDDALTIKNSLPAEVWDGYFKFSIARNPWDRLVSDFHWEKRQDLSLQPRKRFYHYLGIPFDELAEIRKQFPKFAESGPWWNNDRFYTIDDRLCVDYVIRYEDLARDLGEVCRRIGIPAKEPPRLKSGIRKVKRHYSKYYDDKTRDRVAQRHKKDIDLLGYRFERA